MEKIEIVGGGGVAVARTVVVSGCGSGWQWMQVVPLDRGDQRGSNDTKHDMVVAVAVAVAAV